MNVEHWLCRYLELKEQAYLVQARIKVFRASHILPAPVNDGMPHGSGGNHDLSGYAADLMELEEEYTHLWERAKEVRSEIAVTVKRHLPKNQQELFINRYILGASMVENAKLLNVSRGRCYRLWKSGLKRLMTLDAEGKLNLANTGGL